MSGCASQVPVLAVSVPAVSEPLLLAVGAKAAGLTSSGPYAVYPLWLPEPLAGIVFSAQYEAAVPDSLRGANRPVIRKLILALLIPSLSVSTSPGDRCSNAAADAGRAAGMTWPAAGAGGHWPDTSTAWLVMPSSVAASSSSEVPLLAVAGRAGSAPGTRSSGSDHVPDQNSNGTRPSVCATAVRSVLAVAAAWLLLTGPAMDSAVPGESDRSCRSASGSAWPANTVSAAPTAAATSVVSVAA